jgi:large subunit ribosomal protein L4
MYQQKGTGRARAGTRRAHQRRGGARCFGPKPRKYSYELSRKIVDFGLKSALSTKFGQGQLSFVTDDSILFDTHKTSSLAKIIAKMPAKKILLIDSELPQKNLKLAARSLNTSLTILNLRMDTINVYHILKYPCVLLTDRARKYYERYFNASRY